VIHLSQYVLGCALQAVIQGGSQVQDQQYRRIYAKADDFPRVGTAHRHDDQKHPADRSKDRPQAWVMLLKRSP
jgi:hypothetical protein